MSHVPVNASDEQLILFVDRWAELLESEQYEAAFRYTSQDPYMRWTPDLIRQVIQSYGDSRPKQRVTLSGEPTDVHQRKNVLRWPENKRGYLGEIWYDLNIDGYASDLTATFGVKYGNDGLTVELSDIHVM